jgi:DNA-binding IclR family transcriptional regulator
MSEKLIKNFRTSRKDRAILALLEHPTLEKAAEAVGVHSTTLRRWSRQPEFQEALRQARREKFSQSMGLLHLGTNAAISNLLKIMRDPNQPGSTQVRAIDSLLNRVTKAIEIEDILTRLAALERAIHGGKNSEYA